MMLSKRENYFFKLLLFVGFAGSSLYADEPINPSDEQNVTISPEDKVLQMRVLGHIEMVLRFIPTIGSRIDNLKLSKEDQKELRDDLSKIQTYLQKMKAEDSQQVKKEKLIKHSFTLDGVIKGLESSLKKSFTIPLEIDPADIKRSEKDITPEQLDTLLNQTEKKLKGFDKLITNMNNTIFNRWYITASDAWNTPIYSITSLGSSNKQFYISSILKRMFTYSAAVGLVVYNLPKNQLDTISNRYIRSWAHWLKVKIGNSPIATQFTESVKTFPVHPNTHNGWGLGTGPFRTEILMGEEGLPILYGRFGNSLIEIPLEIVNGTLAPTIALEKEISYFISGNNAVITITPETFKTIHYSGSILIDAPGVKESNKIEDIYKAGRLFAQEVAPGVYVDRITRAPLILSESTLHNAIKVPSFSVETPFGWDGQKIPQLFINGSEHDKMLANTSQLSKEDPRYVPGGFLNSFFSNVSWIVSPELRSVGFQLPIATYVTKSIYADLNSLKTDIPAVAAYLHRKLRGESGKLTGIYEIPTTTFDDIVGRDEIKKQFEPLINFMKNPDSFIQSGVQIGRGYLLAGEPQTGKTSFVRSLTGQITKESGKQCRLLPLSIADVLEHGISYWLNLIKVYNFAPCILFIDEFDLTGAQRNEDKKFLADALTSLSGYATSSDLSDLVIFIIATNRPENIDYAIRADGRCGTTIYFENPYLQERRDYFEYYFKKNIIEPKNFNLDVLAQETEACSYGTLKSITIEMRQIADRNNEVPCQKHAEEALDTVVRKVIKGVDDIPLDKREIFASRYGAKALTSLALSPDKKFVAVSIMKMTERIEEKHVLNHYESVSNKDKTGVRFGGLFTYNRSDTYGLINNKERIKECKIAIAGTVGQKVLELDYIAYPEDEKEALKIARHIVFNGCDEHLFPRKIRDEKGIQAYLLVEQCRQEVRELLEAHKEAFLKLVDLLQRRQVLRVSDVKQCLGLTRLDLIDDYFSPLTGLDSQANTGNYEVPTLDPKQLFTGAQEDDELDELDEQENKEQQHINQELESRTDDQKKKKLKQDTKNASQEKNEEENN